MKYKFFVCAVLITACEDRVVTQGGQPIVRDALCFDRKYELHQDKNLDVCWVERFEGSNNATSIAIDCDVIKKCEDLRAHGK